MTDGQGGPAHLTIRRAVRLSHPEDLVRRKAELRLLLLTRRPAAPGPAAVVAVADRLLHEIGVPQAAVVSGYWPLAGELDPRPCLRRLAARGQRLALPRMQGRGQAPVAPADQPLDAVVTERASHCCSLPPELATVRAGPA